MAFKGLGDYSIGNSTWLELLWASSRMNDLNAMKNLLICINKLTFIIRPLKALSRNFAMISIFKAFALVSER